MSPDERASPSFLLPLISAALNHFSLPYQSHCCPELCGTSIPISGDEGRPQGSQGQATSGNPIMSKHSPR